MLIALQCPDTVSDTVTDTDTDTVTDTDLHSFTFFKSISQNYCVANSRRMKKLQLSKGSKVSQKAFQDSPRLSSQIVEL